MKKNERIDWKRLRRQNSESRAFLNVHTQFENAGDALILRELIRLVSSRVKMDVFLGQAPHSFVQQLDVETNASVVPHRTESTAAMVGAIVKARILGARCYLFLTPGAPNGEKSRKAFMIDLLRVGLVAALSFAQVRVCQVGVSAEKIGPRHARLLRWRSRWLYASAPRERIAFEYARSLGIHVTGMVPDLSFNTFSDTRNFMSTSQRSGIGFSFRVDKDPKVRALVGEFVKNYSLSSNEDDELIFVAQVGRDVDFMRDLSELAAEYSCARVRFVDLHRNVEQIFETYNQCRIVFSNRLHALLPSLREGAAPVALTIPEVDPKILGVFETIGLRDRVLDLRNLDYTQIAMLSSPIQFDERAVVSELHRYFDELFDLSGADRTTPNYS